MASPAFPDPFFAALHRRHPDVDLVVLPPETPRRERDVVPGDEVAETLIRVAVQARHLWSAAAPEALERPEARWSYAADPGAVRAVARLTSRRADGFPVLVSLRHELESHGWEVSRPPGAVERLVAFLDELELTASYAESGVFVLGLSSSPLYVGADRARDLVRDQTTDAGDR